MSEVKMTLNCLILGETSFNSIFPVNIFSVNPIIVSNVKYYIKYDELKISDLKYLIWSKKSKTLKIDYELWMVNIIEKEEYKLKGVKESEIGEKLGATKSEPTYTFQNYFPKTFKYDLNIHIIVRVPATTAGSSQGVSHATIFLLVKSFGMNFKFCGRDNTIDILWNGDKVTKQNGIVDQFLACKINNKDKHPIPVLAAGPGTGNLVVINTTYGSGFLASNLDITMGIREVSNNFRSLCNNYSIISAFTLDIALQVVYDDIIQRKNQEKNSNPLLVLVLGSMHKPLRLPLYLLGENHAIEIGKTMNLFDDNYIKLHPYFRISIGDIERHVKALENS
ncbi:P-loop containing nucleoside triphosphate hydrolase protein [Rhizophagus clarus]|uniref:P-loop containing nucleoside triphosphate hydrolase protein n=1 Tax=Rhizophagus clarus TaxID=94130 RepID=A0A8H3M750_9GLOM|nr:P-loop containing nucleoside triphosphate hydrolase protein [Rhizophagus clarus]